MNRWLGLLLGLAIAGDTLAGELLPDEFVVTHQVRIDRLFADLDPAHPEVGPLIEQWNAGQFTSAANALAVYFSDKPFPDEILEPLQYPHDFLRHAEAALTNSFYLVGEWETVPRRPDGGLDWQSRGKNDDKERAWMLNRHQALTYLSHAYETTGKDAFRDKLNSLLRDWIINCPYPDRLSFSPQWRPLEAARRMLNSWTHVFFENDSLEPGTRLLVLSAVADHGDALRHHASVWGGNHLITERLALLTVATAWPELANSSDWKDYAIESVSAELLEQTYPDGSYKELSNHYQHVVQRNALYFLRLLALENPNFRTLPTTRRIIAMWDFYGGVMRPDGTGPLNNASDLEHNATLLKAAAEFHERADWLAMATHGAQGTLPSASPSRYFPWAGQVISRNNWGPHADWIYFDAGPYGTAHQHVDRLHVSASIKGKPVLVDSGRYTYLPGPWRDYFKGPQSHSVILLDGTAAEQGPLEAKQPMPVIHHDREGFVFSSAAARFHSSGSGFSIPAMAPPVPWTRSVLHDKRGFAIIIDHLLTFDRHDFTAIWNFHPDIGSDDAAKYLRLVSSSSNFSQSIQTGSAEPESGGFHSPEYGEKTPSPQMRISGSIDKPTTVIWILQDAMAPQLEVKILSDPGATRLRFSVSGKDGPLSEASVQLHPDVALFEYNAF